MPVPLASPPNGRRRSRTRCAIALLERVRESEKIRLAGVQAHNLERVDAAQIGLFDGWQEQAAKSKRLNRALDLVAERFGDTAVTRGMARADRAAPSRRIK